MKEARACDLERLMAERLMTERLATDRAQALAADPTASAWVSANAGTGKTHVLTTRVLRLLVAGTPPERILCLTYTKAAAAEMSERVYSRLAAWVNIDDAVLVTELERLQQRAPADDELIRARDLFAVAIEAPGGLKVQTIHAFCERLLQRFPLEADVAPGYTTLDEETGRDLQREAIDSVLTEATRDETAPLGQALQRAVAFAADDAFDELLRAALQKRDWIEAASKLEPAEGRDFAGAEAFYRKSLGVAPDATVEAIDQQLGAVLSNAQITRCREVLASGSDTDVKLGGLLGEALHAQSTASRVAAFVEFFLTGSGSPRVNLVTSKPKAANPEVAELLCRAQGRFVSLSNMRGALVLVLSTVALLRLAGAVLQRYIELKRRRAALDFDDLIRATANLLSDGPAAAWVLYKLDGGLDHILVDEAQDTAPLQWRIIEQLAREFYAGGGAREINARTVFAVGDEKQSIYAFQGAEPAQFAEMGARFRALATAAGQVWNPVPLTLSFRTVAPILDTVDRVFASGPGASGVTAGAAVVRHAANRLGAAGLVEIWATEKPDPSAQAEIWSPLEDKAPASPVSRLADRIALTIKVWLDRGEMLVSENRPVRAGDILILVRKRRPFAEAMVAALKAREIAVAGADRIRLTDQLAIQDLRVLGEFLLLPEDDLALATVLKGPFFDLTDNDLMTFAPARRGSLWTALLKAAAGNLFLVPVAETLKRWRARADLSPPYEFFAEVLDRDGMRSRLLRRLGPEAAQPIDEFMSLALTYDDGAPPSLQGFIDSLRRSDREIKRDMEHGRDEVRVMTVHGAKGLEAPIVFLPDTCATGAGGRPGGLVALDTDLMVSANARPHLWAVKGTSTLDAIKRARAAAKEREAEERNRLLYVALTRPRDRLYVAGFEGVKPRAPDCWYNIIANALDGQLEVLHDTDGASVRRIASAQTAAHEKPKHASTGAIEAVPPPAWASEPAPREPGIIVPLVPSRLAPLETDAEGEPVDPPPGTRADPPVLPASRGSDGHRFLRGTLTHALLQHLPSLDAATWNDAAARFIDVRGKDLRPGTRASIVRETLAVLRHTEFAPIFGPASRAEVPIVAEIKPPAGNGEILRVTGQLDRIVRLDTHVLIIDFKTNRPPPTETASVAEAYLLQLAAYRLAVAEVFKPLPVRAALLWTDGPRLMEIPGAMLDAAALRLWRLAGG